MYKYTSKIAFSIEENQDGFKISSMVVTDKEPIFDAQDMFYFKLNGDARSKERRMKLGKELGLGYGNASKMLSRLNNYGVTKEEFIKAINKVEKQIEEGK